MRYDVKKFIFIGLSEDKSAFFKEAQKVGIIHFIHLDPTKIKESPANLQDTIKAIKVLRGLPPLEQEENTSPLSAVKISERIIALKNKWEKLEEELRITKLEMARVGIFGSFSPKEVELIEKEGKRSIQFFSAKHGFADKMKDEPNLIYIGSENALDYFIAINPASRNYEGMIEMKIDHPIQELKLRSEKIKEEIHQAENELKPYAKYNKFLHEDVIRQMNEYNLENAESTVLPELDHALFVASGWVPVNKTAELHAIAKGKAVQMEEVAVEASDSVPTYLENHGPAKLGEDLIGIYDTPSTTDKDPSLWVLIFFALFFAFIVGDGGYGAVIFGVTLYFRYKYPNLKGVKKRVLNILTILSVACMIWGILISSFFGMSLDPDHSFRKVSLTNWLATKKAEYHMTVKDKSYENTIAKVPHLAGITDPKEFLMEGYTIDASGRKNFEILNGYVDGILLELALLIGVIHLCLGLLRYANRNLSSLGWVAFLIGGYLYFPFYLGAPSMLSYAFGFNMEKTAQVGLQLMMIGVPFAVGVAVIRTGLLGLTEIMNLIQVFADVLSYLRLYALGLAGAIVSATINQMADALPLLIAIVLIVVSHVLNIFLGIVGGLIHGLRLNFLEWYHYSFEGGGKPFKALKTLRPE